MPGLTKTKDSGATRIAQLCQALKLIESGLSLRKATENAGLTPWKFLGQCEKDAEFAKQYARARSIGDDVQFEDLHEEMNEEPLIVDGRIDPGWVNLKRLKIDTKKWALSKRKPSKYGDKTQLTNDAGDGPAELIIRRVGG